MNKMTSRSDQDDSSGHAGVPLPAWATAIVVLGMALIVLGVAHGALFVPGVWLLMLGFIALIASAIYGVAVDRAERT